MSFQLFDIAINKMMSWWRPGQSAPLPDGIKPSIELQFRVSAAIICGWPLPEGVRVSSGGAITVDTYQELAERLCKWALEEESHKDFEPPDIHMHPEPMPFDYNNWQDHKGRHIWRHNYDH